MQDPALAPFIDRVTHLEDEVSRLWRAGAVAAVLLTGLTTMLVILVLHATPAAIHTQRVVFQDVAGRARAALVVSRAGPPVLQLVDPDGRVRWQAP